MSTVKNYTSPADLQNFWLKTIAPNYFSAADINTYRVGIFGYINEVMANTTADAFNAINIARREFYPITAQNPQSMYKMAATQKITLPTTTAPTAKAILLIPQKDIIDNSTYSNGVYTCVLDNTLKIQADNIPFLLDYPIVILSKQKGGTWTHTIHYDTAIVNDLNTTSEKYIMNKTIFQDGVKYVLMSVSIRQLELFTISDLITKDSTLDTISMNFTFEGDLANFDVEYVEEPGVSSDVQLTKILDGGGTLETPFCHYKMVDDNVIQITFPKNSYFTPKLNSEIRLNIYTSLGKGGEFETFGGSLTCSAQSEKYPYNDNMTVTGIINGACRGGIAKPDDDEFRNIILKAYSTNNTITSTNDLQIYFDHLSKDAHNRILFRKKRDDALLRLYGAYCLLKDESSNVVPTNTVNIHMNINEFDVFYKDAGRAIIKPGSIFEYLPNQGAVINYDAKKVTDLTLMSNLDVFDDNSRFLFTNPFLIAITLNPNIVGFYYNALNATKAVNYSYVNDNTMIQFIGSSLKVTRNPIIGENFYKFSINIAPSTDIDESTIIKLPLVTDADYSIRAKDSGMVISYKYEVDHIVCRVKYADTTTEDIVCNNYSTLSVDGTYTYTTGYTMNFEVYDKFVKGDVLATKKPTDLGRIRAALDFTGLLYNENLYIPMCIDSYDEEVGGYTLTGYISTDDVMTLESTMVIDNGIYKADGTENKFVNIPMTGLQAAISIFFKNDDTNQSHKYSDFKYFTNYTMTNTYEEDGSDKLSLIQQIDFIRSTMVFTEGPDPEVIYMTLKEVPVAKSNWIKDSDNFKYLTSTIYKNYENLYNTYFLLENNFGIDMKFYNTYGKSRFYKVGIADQVSILSHVNCSFRFGIYLSALISQDIFLESFRTYVKEYVETINNIDSDGTAIYILNMIKDIENNFPEIGYMEYYGFDEYLYSAQKIEPLLKSELSNDLLVNYIPEFVNVYTYKKNGVNVPKIDVTFLKKIEE